MRQVEDLKNTVVCISDRCFKAEKHRIELLTATTKVLNQLTPETYPSVAIYDLRQLIKKINQEISK